MPFCEITVLFGLRVTTLKNIAKEGLLHILEGNICFTPLRRMKPSLFILLRWNSKGLIVCNCNLFRLQNMASLKVNRDVASCYIPSGFSLFASPNFRFQIANRLIVVQFYWG